MVNTNNINIKDLNCAIEEYQKKIDNLNHLIEFYKNNYETPFDNVKAQKEVDKLTQLITWLLTLKEYISE